METPTTPSWGRGKLPVEILYVVTDFALTSWMRLEVQHLLCSLCLVNRRFRQWCQPRLFRRLDLEIKYAAGIIDAFHRNPTLGAAVNELKVWGLGSTTRGYGRSADHDGLLAMAEILGSFGPTQIQRMEISGSSRISGDDDYTVFRWEGCHQSLRHSLERLVCESRSLRLLKLSEGRGVPFYLVFSPTLQNVQLFNATIDVDESAHQSHASLKQLKLLTPTDSVTFHHFAEVPTLFNLQHLTKLTIDLRDGRLHVLEAILAQCHSSLEEMYWRGSRWLSEDVTINISNCTKLTKLSIIQPLEHVESKCYPSTFSLLERLNIPSSLELLQIQVQCTRPYSVLPPQKADEKLSPHLKRLDRSLSSDNWRRLRGVSVELGLPSEREPFPYTLPLQEMSNLLARGILSGLVSSIDPLVEELENW